jgi:hypothetical protein
VQPVLAAASESTVGESDEPEYLRISGTANLNKPRDQVLIQEDIEAIELEAMLVLHDCVLHGQEALDNDHLDFVKEADSRLGAEHRLQINSESSNWPLHALPVVRLPL